MRAFVDKVYGVLRGCHIYDFQIMDAAARSDLHVGLQIGGKKFCDIFHFFFFP